SDRESELHHKARELYEERLRFGVAREQARKDLPLSTYTEAYWKIDGHNLLHFLELRMEKHAQLEIRTYANAIAELIKPYIPLTWEAFEDYCLNSMTLSGIEQQMIREIVSAHVHKNEINLEECELLNKREKTEFIEKLSRLGW
ncbi:MAG: FAD-dependent thymidylate synthase, partial [Candidatus Cloacimonetes bacterium]|nr:FAD-dependent thymidylate synthase [Candidatus Cloacimonadota bacterium]